jgi:hypothetical protein
LHGFNSDIEGRIGEDALMVIRPDHGDPLAPRPFPSLLALEIETTR